MTWVIEMPESRRERRSQDESREASYDKQDAKSNGGPDNLSVAILMLFLVGILLISVWIVTTNAGQTFTIPLGIVGCSLVGIGIILLILAPIYRNLNSIKNYLRSIDEKLDQ